MVREPWEVYLAGANTNTPSSSPFLVPAEVPGLRVCLTVDRRFDGMLLYGDRLRKGLPGLRMQGEPTVVSMGGIRATRVKLPSGRIAGREEITPVVLIDGLNEKLLPGVAGWVGLSSLHARWIEFDLSAMILHLP